MTATVCTTVQLGQNRLTTLPNITKQVAKPETPILTPCCPRSATRPYLTRRWPAWPPSSRADRDSRPHQRPSTPWGRLAGVGAYRRSSTGRQFRIPGFVTETVMGLVQMGMRARCASRSTGPPPELAVGPLRCSRLR